MSETVPEMFDIAKMEDKSDPSASEITAINDEISIIDKSDKNTSKCYTNAGSSQFKRKRIHLDTVACAEIVKTEEGSMPLSNPHIVPTVKKDVNRGLHPVIRNKRRKMDNSIEIDLESEKTLCNVDVLQQFNSSQSSQGFVSASKMYDIHNKTNHQNSNRINNHFNTSINKTQPVKKGKQIKQVINQRSLEGFFSSTKPTVSSGGTCKVKDHVGISSPSLSASVMYCPIKKFSTADSKSSVMYSPKKELSISTADSKSSVMYSPKKELSVSTADSKSSVMYSPKKELSISTADSKSSVMYSPKKELSMSTADSKSSVMFSPIKKLSTDDNQSCIYISDDSSCSLSSSQSSLQGNSQKSAISDNVVVKQLFEAAKNFDPKVKLKGKKNKATNSPYLKNTERKTTDGEGAKYFESDSFDFSTAFDSDMDDNTFCDNVDSDARKKVGGVEQDKYGLLGSGSYPKEEKVNYFERLPPEVLENIFCQLPMLDLCLNSNRVCLQWNSIIADEKFVPWKKLYHKLKADEGSSRDFMNNTMRAHEMDQPTKYLSSLIRYMKDFKPVTASNMLQCLQKHKKYCWAKDLIEERLQDCKSHEEPNPWSVIAILVIVAHKVYDIQEIIQCLSVSSSQCTSKEIIECLYCIATFLYAFKLAKSCDVWNGMHYRLFYALYLFENASSSSCADLHSIMSESKGGQQSLVKYSSGSDSVRLTHEQLRIVKHRAGPHEIIKIVAFAGTGKTTTLVRYTQLRPDKKFLLVVYNKSVCDYAKTKFPRNVECRTGHSLAFQSFGRRYLHKLYQLKVYTLTQVLQARKGENLFLQAKFTMSTIENFLASDDTCIDIHHVPDTRFNEKTGIKESIDLPTKRLYVRDADFIWRKMQDPKEKKIGMSHDGYLKLYQLSQPYLRGYDCILIDEAQDLTPAITDVLLRQRQGKILVGDPHQQIYSFRGAVNAMNKISADTLFYLTQSFRFGPEISQVAMSCLEVLKKEKKKTLVGSGKKCVVNGDKVGQLAIISRCNFTVFSEAVKKCCYSDEESKVAFVGGTSNFGFPMLMDMYALTLSEHERKKGLEVKNKFIQMFKSFGDLDKFATKSMDNELLGKIKIVKTYNHNLPLHIRKIESKCVKDERRADYVFSTAHKAKGLEFSSVRVTDDFLGNAARSMMTMLGVVHHQLDDNDGMNGMDHVGAFVGAVMGAAVRMVNNDPEKTDDEENLLYVAVTRAKNALQMSPTLLSVLKRAGENFQFPVYSNEMKESGRTFSCLETGAEFSPHCLTLEKKKIILGDGQQRSGGLYSPAFLTEDFHSFASLLGLTNKEITEEKKKKNASVDPEVFYPHQFDVAGD